MIPSASLNNALRARFQSRHAGLYAPLTSWLLVVPLIATVTIGFLYPVGRLVLLSFANGGDRYLRLVQDPLYFGVLAATVTTAATVTLSCLALGYPVAYAMTRLRGPAALVTAACVFISLWTSVLIRSYAWIVLLQRHGIINELLRGTGLIDHPLSLLYTHGAVVLGMTHILVPFAILPIYSTLRTVPRDLTRAAASLGAGRVRTFTAIVFPLSLPGVFAGGILCFVLSLGFYVTPALLGGPGSLLMATLIGQQTTVLLDWPFAAALSTILLAVTLLVVALFRRTFSLSKGFTNVH